MSAVLHHPRQSVTREPLRLLQRPVRAVAAPVVAAATVVAQGPTWLERLAAWAERQPRHHRMGSSLDTWRHV